MSNEALNPHPVQKQHLYYRVNFREILAINYTFYVRCVCCIQVFSQCFVVSYCSLQLYIMSVFVTYDFY